MNMGIQLPGFLLSHLVANPQIVWTGSTHFNDLQVSSMPTWSDNTSTSQCEPLHSPPGGRTVIRNLDLGVLQKVRDLAGRRVQVGGALPALDSLDSGPFLERSPPGALPS